MDETTWLWQALRILLLFSWLFFVLPIFDAFHQRFSLQVFPSSNRAFNPLHWFLDLWRVLGQKSTQHHSLQENYLRRVLLLISLISSTTVLSILPLSTPWQVGDSLEPLANGADPFSLFFVLALIFSTGFVYTVIGFSLGTNLMPLIALEQFFSRQSVILVIVFACLSLPLAQGEDSLQAIVLNQTISLSGQLPSWGALLNPIGFIAACVALAFYTRQWFDNEVATQGILRKPIETRLVGTLLLTFKIARNLEYLAIYAILTTIFLGGPLIGDYHVHPAIALGFFTGKLFLLVAFVLGISHLLPRLRDEQVVRMMLLYLLPIAFVGYFSTKWFTDLLESSGAF